MDAQQPLTNRDARTVSPAGRSAIFDPRNTISVPWSSADVALHFAIIGLTIATAVIHARLGGLLFLANAAGYATLALAMVAPLPVARRYRWLVRFALLGFTSATIAGWLAFGARFQLAYLDKGIEALLVGCLVAEAYRLEGSPFEAVRRLVRLARSAIAR
jgi:hypothetical protein